MRTIKHSGDGGFVVTDNELIRHVPADDRNRDHAEIGRRAALPAGDPERIDVLAADPPPAEPSAAETFDAELVERPAFAALVRWMAKDRGLTEAQIRDALITEMEAKP